MGDATDYGYTYVCTSGSNVVVSQLTMKNTLRIRLCTQNLIRLTFVYTEKLHYHSRAWAQRETQSIYSG